MTIVKVHINGLECPVEKGKPLTHLLELSDAVPIKNYELERLVKCTTYRGESFDDWRTVKDLSEPVEDGACYRFRYIGPCMIV